MGGDSGIEALGGSGNNRLEGSDGESDLFGNKEMTSSLAWKEKQIPSIVALEQIPLLTLMQLNETIKLEIVRTSGTE